MIQELLQKRDVLHQDLLRRQGQRDLLRQEESDLGVRQKVLVEDKELLISARRLLEFFVKSTEVTIKEYIEPVVTEALGFVFNQNLQFHLLFVSRRNQIECDFIVTRSDEIENNYQTYSQDPKKYEKQLESLVKELKDINFMYGGAVNQVIACVLRLVIAELFGIQGPIVLDEPSSAVGEANSGKLGKLISSLSKRFNRQYIYSTHSIGLASHADKVYTVEISNGVSSVKEDV